MCEKKATDISCRTDHSVLNMVKNFLSEKSDGSDFSELPPTEYIIIAG